MVNDASVVGCGLNGAGMSAQTLEKALPARIVLPNQIASQRLDRKRAFAGKTDAVCREWNPSKRWNPFNSYKLLAHVDRWRHIKRGKPIPPPILITVDPTNSCNLHCEWCNAERVCSEQRNAISEKALLSIADFLPRWGQGNSQWKPGVGAICIAGVPAIMRNPAIEVQ